MNKRHVRDRKDGVVIATDIQSWAESIGGRRGPAVGGCYSPAGGVGISHQTKRKQRILLYAYALSPFALSPDPILELVDVFVL